MISVSSKGVMTTMTNTKKRLIVIVGATGSGKTDLSIQLALYYNAPIVSTDSRQVYKGMPIGTAQPTEEQLRAVEHHFVAVCDIHDKFNCGIYEDRALQTLETLFKQHDNVVAVGGSGLYIKALCEGMDDLPDVDEALRSELSARVKAVGLSSLLDELKELDPDYYEIVDRHNAARVQRALEVCKQSGVPYSQLRKGESAKRDFEIVKIGIDMDRKELYSRIDRRVDMMIEEGLEEEVRSLYEFRELNSLQTVGYRELFDYFDGTTTREEAIDLIKRNSRRYAKRQITWFRRDESISWFSKGDFLLIKEALKFGE